MFDSEGNHEPSNSQVPTTFLLFTRLSWHEHFLSLSYVSNQHPPEQKIFCCVHDFCVFYWCKGCPINHSFHSCFRKFVPFSWRIYFKQCIGFQEVLVIALVEYWHCPSGQSIRILSGYFQDTFRILFGYYLDSIRHLEKFLNFRQSIQIVSG